MQTHPLRPILFLGLLVLFCSQAEAQCPTRSGQGIHVVQKGETLYAIAQKYQITTGQIANWNGIDPMSVLYVCQELRVRPEIPQETAPASGRHVIQSGQTIEGIARMYGYTEARFRHFNKLRPDEPAWPGLVLKTSDCVCEDQQREAGNARSGSGSDIKPVTTEPGTTIPDRHPERNRRTGRNDIMEDPFYNGESSAPVSYGNPEDQPPATTETNPYAGLVPADNAPGKPVTNANARAYPAGMTVIERDHFPYMSDEEVSMINEINLLRFDPPGYIKYVEEYMEKVRKGLASGSFSGSRELIRQLRQTSGKPSLQPVRCLYEAAMRHGLDQQPTGFTDHLGTDGSYPWDRIRVACPFMTDGGENIVGGPDKVRDAVMLLLIDDGVAGRIHRRNLLDPEWVYVACYKIGQVGSMPNSWIQKFGK